MPFKTPITVREAIDLVHQNRFILPSIQREVVWDEDRIVRLFDSLVRGYPINSFLFWKVPSSIKHKFQFYEFMRQYHERDFNHNPKANVDGVGDITAVLDGQQRLTALYIGLRSTYAVKLHWRRRDDPAAYPKRQLYLNLSAPIPEEDQQEYGLSYDFRFLTEQQAQERDEGAFWFKVGRILDFDRDDPAEVWKFLVDNGLGNNNFAGQCLFKLNQVVQKEPIISYYEEEQPDLERVLNIFVRINSGGVPLSHSDLLLSIATSQWRRLDARETIQSFVDELKRLGDGFDFDKDFVLKACLVLADLDVSFKVRNFSKTNMGNVERQWDTISTAIRTSVELADAFGFRDETLPSKNALIPIAYYLKAIKADRSFITHSRFGKDRKLIRNWLTVALLRRLFGGQSDSVLRIIRTSIRTHHENGFPYQAIGADILKSKSKSMGFTDEELEGLLHRKYGRDAFLVLSLLYPTLDYRNEFHQDHIHPRSFFSSGNKLTRLGVAKVKQEYYMENCNCVPNLQLLEGAVNREKQDMAFGDWLNQAFRERSTMDEFKRRHYIPEVNLSLVNFEQFIESRKALMLKKLKEILG